MTESVITEAIDRVANLNTKADLKDAIWRGDQSLREELPGKQVTALAKALDWTHYEFERADESASTPRAAILEEVNNTTLATLGVDGVVYQLGDTIRFETTRSSCGWGRSTSSEKVTRENQIDYLSTNHISISRHPTYSNTPKDSPSAHPGRTDIEIVKRSDLSEYRERLTEGTDIDIPESVNGWELVNKEVREHDPEETLLSHGIVTELKWSNGETTYITAKWRGSYGCYRLSIPVEGVLTEENVDDHLYEIDVPQQVVTTEELLELATDAMSKMDPADFQAPYDLRDSDKADGPADLRHEFAPVNFPMKVGDWELTERDKYSLLYKNTNQQSAWEGFTVKIDFHGGVKVKNVPDDEIHDRRLIKKHFPNGDPHPGNVNSGEYAWRRREMFKENWFHGVCFLIQTSKQPLNDSVKADLKAQVPNGVDIETYDHGLSTDAMQTMERSNGTLLAY